MGLYLESMIDSGEISNKIDILYDTFIGITI